MRPLADRVLGTEAAGLVLARIRRGDPGLYLDVASAQGPRTRRRSPGSNAPSTGAPGQARTADAARRAAQLIAAPRRAAVVVAGLAAPGLA